MTDEPLKGKQFRAKRRLSDADNRTLVDVGQTCERVPVSSLPGLLASGKIEPVRPLGPETAPPISVEPAPLPVVTRRRSKGEA